MAATFDGKPITKKLTTIGTNNCDITLTNPAAASKHAEIWELSPDQVKKKVYAIIDLGGGTFVNDKLIKDNRTTPHLLSPGDDITFGGTAYDFKQDFLTVKLGDQEITKPVTTIGTDNGSDIHLKDPGADNKHAEIHEYSPSPGQQTYIFYDLGFGTSINHKRLQTGIPYILNSGDKIRIGNGSFIFEQPVTKQTAAKQQSHVPGWMIALFFLFVGGLVIWSINNPSQNNDPSTPRKTLTTFCNALNNSDYQAAYDQLSSNVQGQETESQFASQQQQLFIQQGGLKKCAVGDIQTGNSTTTGTLIFTFNKGKSVSHIDPLIQENGSWKINSLKP